MSPDIYISLGILELYVAGTLSPEEVEEVQAMADKHPLVAEEIKRIEDAHLKYAALHAPELSAGIFDRLARKIEELPVAAEPLPEAPKSKFQSLRNNKEKPAATVAEPRAEKPKSPQPQKPVRRTSGGLYTVIVLLFIVLSLSALANYYLYEKWQSAEINFAQMETEYLAIRNEHSNLKAQYEELYYQHAPYNHPDIKKINITGQSIAPQASALVYWNPQSEEVYLQVENLPEAPAGKKYQLWAIDADDKYVNAGVISSTSNTTISPMKKVPAAKAFAITLEPEGGSQNPTLDALYVKGSNQ